MKRLIFYETTVCKCYHGENMGVFSLEPGEGPSPTLASTWRTHAPEPMWICINRMMEKSQHCSWSDAHQFENTGRIRQKIVRKSLEKNLRTESNKTSIWLVVLTILKNMNQLGRIIPYIMEKKCSKPPTSLLGGYGWIRFSPRAQGKYPMTFPFYTPLDPIKSSWNLTKSH